MNVIRLGVRGLAVLGAIALLVGVIGAGTATSDVAPLTNPNPASTFTPNSKDGKPAAGSITVPVDIDFDQPLPLQVRRP